MAVPGWRRRRLLCSGCSCTRRRCPPECREARTAARGWWCGRESGGQGDRVLFVGRGRGWAGVMLTSPASKRELPAHRSHCSTTTPSHSARLLSLWWTASASAGTARMEPPAKPPAVAPHRSRVTLQLAPFLQDVLQLLRACPPPPQQCAARGTALGWAGRGLPAGHLPDAADGRTGRSQQCRWRARTHNSVPAGAAAWASGQQADGALTQNPRYSRLLQTVTLLALSSGTLMSRRTDGAYECIQIQLQATCSRHWRSSPSTTPWVLAKN